MRTFKELLEDSVEQMKHIHSISTNGRLYATTESLIKEIQQALNIPDVVQQSELLSGFRYWYDHLSIEEDNMYEGRYEEVYLATL